MSKYKVKSGRLRNITLSAPSYLIEQARKRASENKQTLNSAFRDWLARFANNDSSIEQYDLLMENLKHIKVPTKFTREDLNER